MYFCYFSNVNLFAFIVFLLSAHSAQATYFSDISLSSGVNIPHSSSTFGIGQGWFDVDNDGDLDIYVTGQKGSNHLLVNQGNEQFIELAQFNNLAVADQACVGISIADYDNDGWDDIYVNCLGDNHLFRNINGQKFIDVTQQSGVNDNNNSQVSAWADINNDGWLDLYVSNYNNNQSFSSYDKEKGSAINAAKDSLFLSNGDGTFININEDLEAFDLNKPGLAVTFFDYDNDGDQDLYVVVDRFHGNVLWKNVGPATPECGIHWCFKDVSEETGTDAKVYGMGIATGDIDLDGDMDMYFSSIDEQLLLINQLSQGSESFIDVSDQSVLNFPGSAGWATVFFDYDNDSLLDAMIATYGSNENTSEKLFKGNGDGTFVDVTMEAGITDNFFTEGLAYADMNKDGLLDILKGNNNDGYKLYKNNLASTNNWLEIELIGYGSINRNAIGAKVTVLTTDGKRLIREVSSGDARGSTHQRALHFGLGLFAVENMLIEWPNGTTEIFKSVEHNRSHFFFSPEGQMIFADGFE